MENGVEYYDRTTKEFRDTIFDDDLVKSVKVRMYHRADLLNSYEFKINLTMDLFLYFKDWCEINLPLYNYEHFAERLRKRIYYLIIVIEACNSIYKTKDEIKKKCHDILVQCFLKNKSFLKEMNTELLLKIFPEMPFNVAQIIVDHVARSSKRQRLSNVSIRSNTFSQ